MDHETQRERAAAFHELHTEPDILCLPNAWDAASAIVYAKAGFPAVATTSFGIAASHGHPSGAHLTREEMLAVVERVADSVVVPVSADMEAGYGDTPAAVGETARLTLAAGAVGINLEDGTGDPDDPLVPAETHVERIRAAQEAAEAAGIPLFVNGRTDVFWREVGPAETRLDRTIDRANAYVAAGSDCLFVPGVIDAATIEALVDSVDAPLNVLAGPDAPPLDELAALGVARVTLGAGPLRAALARLDEVSEELRGAGTYTSLAGGMSFEAFTAFLSDASDRQ